MKGNRSHRANTVYAELVSPSAPESRYVGGSSMYVGLNMYLFLYANTVPKNLEIHKWVI